VRNLSAAPLALLLVAFWIAPARAVQVGIDAHAAVTPAVAPVSGVEFRYDAAQIADGYAQAKASFETDLSAIAAIPPGQRTFENTVKAFELANARFGERVSPLVFLSSVSPDEKAREAAHAVEAEVGEYSVSVMLREDLYAAMKTAAERSSGLSYEDSLLLKRTMEGFKSAGHGLSAEAKARLKAIQERLANLGPEFEKNINDDNTRFLAAPEELKGVPQSYVKTLEKTADGKLSIPITEPDMMQVVRFADDGEVRRRYELAYNRRAAGKNEALLSEALRLRDEQARILGADSYPDLALEDRMAAKPQNVWDFLNGLLPILRERGIKELSDLLAVKRRYEPDATRVHSWDLRYLGEKIRQERYGVDSQELKKYFPMDTVVAGTMRVYQRILGVNFTEVPSPEKWHQDVRLFRIDDPKTGEEIGYFYLDLYPRDGKYTHGAAFTIVNGRELETGGYRKPVSAMVVNFEQGKNGEPTLVPIEDVETFFHEFGHLMHQTLTKARYASQSGTSVALDFVEAPSQMLENFVWEREVLDEISGHVDDPSRKIPDDLYQKLTAVRRFKSYGGALFYLRQLAFAMIDMTFHTAVPRSTSRLFNQFMEQLWMVTINPQTRFEASFGHLIGGYGAGYYAYLWSEVFADDIFTRFKKEGLFNPAVGLSWRKEVLEKGSSRPESDSLRAFLGREPSDAAFRAKIEGPKTATAEDLQKFAGAQLEAVLEASRVPGVLTVRPAADAEGLYWEIVHDARYDVQQITLGLMAQRHYLDGRHKLIAATRAPIGA